MIGDDERLEVAKRLRELAPGSDWPKTVAVACGMDTAKMSGNFHEYTEQLCMRLADLIEPVDRNNELCAHCDYCDYCDLPECSEQDGYSFKPKGYVDLLVLADKTIRSARYDRERCGDTVPAWYAAGRLEAVARSIREILGVCRED